jgi:hypothetical protein
MLEDDGDMCLDWRVLYITITPAGDVSWGLNDGKKHKEYGHDLKRVKEIIKEFEPWTNQA